MLRRVSTGSRRDTSSSRVSLTNWDVSFTSRSRTTSNAAQPDIDVASGADQNEVAVQDFFIRGPSRLPMAPTRLEDKPILTPVGDRHWHEETMAEKQRMPSSILGLIIRDRFPGLVKYKGREEPAWSWKHYELVSDPVTEPERCLDNLLQRVEEDFWIYFRWQEGTEDAARRVVHNLTKKIITDMIYEARVQAVMDYYKLVEKQAISRSEACRTYLTLDQYMKIRPWWAKKCPNAWRKLAELKWCNEDWKRKSCEGRERKERMTGPAHRQGSASITRYTRKLEREEKKSFSHIEAYTIARRIDPDGTTFSQSTKDKLEAYKDVVEAMHGPDFDWIKEPIDPIAVYKAGGGKKRGRFMLGDGFINTQEVLAEVRTLSSTTLDDIRPPRQRRTDPPAGTAIQQFRVEMEREREAWRQELQREREARIQDREYFTSQIKETSESAAAATAAGGENHIGPCEDQVDESSPIQSSRILVASI